MVGLVCGQVATYMVDKATVELVGNAHLANWVSDTCVTEGF